MKGCAVGRSFDAGHPVCVSCERQDAAVCLGQLQAKAARPSKHGNVKVEIDGIVFDSKREGARYCTLKLQQRAGMISDLELQVEFVLQPAVVLDGRKKPALRYWADFVYQRDGRQVIEDAKSPHLRKHPVYRSKKHLMKSVLGLDIVEV